jgi:hypothetical protein
MVRKKDQSQALKDVAAPAAGLVLDPLDRGALAGLARRALSAR